MVNITEKQYNKWKRFALVIAENDEYYADEILHTFLEKLIIKLQTKPEFDITDNYVFISLNNTNLNTIDKEKNVRKREEKYHNDNYGLGEHSEELEGNKRLMLKAIEEVALSLEEGDQELFVLHFTYKYAQRRIARESTETLAVIHDRIKKMKDKIKIRYNQLKNEAA